MTHHDKTRSNTLDYKPKEVVGADEDLMDKKSGKAHFSVYLAEMCDAESKKISQHVCALEHTESTGLEDTE